jgi:hypothetical protein
MISVIVNSRDDAKFDAMHRSYAAALRAVEHEFVRIADATGMCEGYNRGVAQSRGAYLLFVHDDTEILFEDDFAPTLARHFERFDVFGPLGTTKLLRPAWSCVGPPYVCGMLTHQVPGALAVDAYGTQRRAFDGAQAIDGLFIAATRDACGRIGPWDADTFTGWHMYDVDYSYRAHLAGLRCGIVCDLGVMHSQAADKRGAVETPEYRTAAKKLLLKHQSTLPPPPPFYRNWVTTAVQVRDRADAAHVMRQFLALATDAPTPGNDEIRDEGAD